MLCNAKLVTSSKALFSTKCIEDLCINNSVNIISIPEETSGVAFICKLVSTDTPCMIYVQIGVNRHSLRNVGFKVSKSSLSELKVIRIALTLRHLCAREQKWPPKMDI